MAHTTPNAKEAIMPCLNCDAGQAHAHCHFCNAVNPEPAERCVACNVRLFTPTLKIRGMRPVARVGDKVNSYGGRGVVTAVEPDDFYGAEPMSLGEAVRGEWDGLVYTVDCTKDPRPASAPTGRVERLDRTRLVRLSR